MYFTSLLHKQEDAFSYDFYHGKSLRIHSADFSSCQFETRVMTTVFSSVIARHYPRCTPSVVNRGQQPPMGVLNVMRVEEGDLCAIIVKYNFFIQTLKRFK